MNEQWKTHPVFKEYEISDRGRVRHIKYLTPTKFKDHYLQVQMGKVKRKCVHSLVLEAFVGPREKGKCVRHIDGNKDNNNLDNLKYGTYQENAFDRIAHGTNNHGSLHVNAKLTEEKVLRLRELAAAGIKTVDLAREYGICRRQVRSIVTRQVWRHI